jgi:hypothetical protein
LLNSSRTKQARSAAVFSIAEIGGCSGSAVRLFTGTAIVAAPNGMIHQLFNLQARRISSGFLVFSDLSLFV